MNERWANDERFVNGERERTVNAERKTEHWTHDERTLNARWTDGERTVNERKNGKVERFRDCMFVKNIVYAYTDFIDRIIKSVFFLRKFIFANFASSPLKSLF